MTFISSFLFHGIICISIHLVFFPSRRGVNKFHLHSLFFSLYHLVSLSFHFFSSSIFIFILYLFFFFFYLCFSIANMRIRFFFFFIFLSLFPLSLCVFVFFSLSFCILNISTSLFSGLYFSLILVPLSLSVSPSSSSFYLSLTFISPSLYSLFHCLFPLFLHFIFPYSKHEHKFVFISSISLPLYILFSPSVFPLLYAAFSPF